MSQYDVVMINTPLVRYGFNLSGVVSIPHLGLGYLGAVLDRAGYRVAYRNAQFTPENPLLHPAGLPDAPIYFLTAKITNLAPTHEIAVGLKRLKPNARVVLGGPCNIVQPDLLFEQFPAFDLLATGEGEAIVVPLVEALLAGGDMDALRAVPGMAIRHGDSTIDTGPAPSADLNEKLFPLRRLWRHHPLRLHPPYGIFPPATLMETARGCSYNCRFCCISKEPRSRPIDWVVEEARELVEDRGVREIHFVDPTFTMDPDRALALCRRLQDVRGSLHWSCKTRPDCVSPALLREMAASGCYMIAYGIESAASEVLDQVNKSIDLEQTRRALEETHAAGIRSIGYVLVGSPGETSATIRRTNRFIRKANTWFVLFGVYLPLPDAEREPDKAALIPEIIRYYTTGRSKEFETVAPAGFTHRQLNRWLLHSVLSFYFYPPAVWRILRGFGSLREVLHYGRGAAFLVAELGRFALRRFRSRFARNVQFSDSNKA
ncbi:MAG: radical SAM protein [Candidatus Lernaella stagnicola]|nr:radical SAM protein [Candidatus Lernaella stagnicola]